MLKGRNSMFQAYIGDKNNILRRGKCPPRRPQRTSLKPNDSILFSNSCTNINTISKDTRIKTNPPMFCFHTIHPITPRDRSILSKMHVDDHLSDLIVLYNFLLSCIVAQFVISNEWLYSFQQSAMLFRRQLSEFSGVPLEGELLLLQFLLLYAPHCCCSLLQCTFLPRLHLWQLFRAAPPRR